MKRTILLVFTVLFSSTGFCQLPKFTWNPPKEKKENPGWFTIRSHNSKSGFYLSRGYFDDKMTLMHLDSAFNPISEKEDIKVSKSKVNGNSQGNIKASNNKFAIYYSEVKNGKKSNTLYYDVYDSNTFEKEIEEKELMSHKFDRPKVYGDGRINSYKFYQSEDFNQQLIVYKMAESEGKKAHVDIRTLNNEMRVNWSRVIELPHASENYDFKDAAIGNDGSVYILGSFQGSNAKGKSKDGDAKLELLVVPNGSDPVQSELVDLGTPIIQDVKMTINKQEKVIFGGLYSLKYNFVRGAFCAVYDIDSKTMAGSSKFNYTPEFAGYMEVKAKGGATVSKSRTDLGEIHFLELTDLEYTPPKRTFFQ